MIITQTPLRVSFFGGGTDFADFYREEEGCVLTSAIDKYIFVIVRQRYDAMIRVGYTRTELVDRVEKVEHELAREALRTTGVDRQVEINTMADIPSAGSGLGSSSTVTVGLLNALHAFQNESVTFEQLAREACAVEIERLGKPIGKQDQYIAAFGGLRFIHFCPDGQVMVETVPLGLEERRRFRKNLMLFFTNHTRKSESVLTEQREHITDRRCTLRRLREMAYEARARLENKDFDGFGHMLDESWQLKKSLASKISNESIDGLYEAARRAGALGGKVTGAGGGGYLLLYCPVERQEEVREALRGCPELPFRLERNGSRVIFDHRRNE